jgi:formylglycine-generating enzyme required for sulfatase activity
MDNGTNKDRLINWARDILRLGDTGVPLCQNSVEIYNAMYWVQRFADDEVRDELLTRGFLLEAAERRDAYIEKHLVPVASTSFDMGTTVAEARHFCGETPRHTVDLSEFRICEFPVTNEMFAIFDPARRDMPLAERRKPVVNVSWFDAVVFATWVGCRLPTEAEWEFSCGVGTANEWCCAPADLPQHAWYSENAERFLHPVATREPNSLGIFDMHGNVWEWCQDAYAQDYYARSPRKNPVNEPDPFFALTDVHRVSRGGGFLALSEMCRVRYRLHDPATYSAADLGFRLAC